MKDCSLGIFDIGEEGVTIKVRDGQGGEFATKPQATLWVGIGVADWGEVAETLMHEITEFVCFRSRVRFTVDGSYSNDHSGYMFAFSHVQFAEICARASRCIEMVRPHLREAWEVYHNPRTHRQLGRRKRAK